MRRTYGTPRPRYFTHDAAAGVRDRRHARQVGAAPGASAAASRSSSCRSPRPSSSTASAPATSTWRWSACPSTATGCTACGCTTRCRSSSPGATTSWPPPTPEGVTLADLADEQLVLPAPLGLDAGRRAARLAADVAGRRGRDRRRRHRRRDPADVGGPAARAQGRRHPSGDRPRARPRSRWSGGSSATTSAPRPSSGSPRAAARAPRAAEPPARATGCGYSVPVEYADRPVRAARPRGFSA